MTPTSLDETTEESRLLSRYLSPCWKPKFQHLFISWMSLFENIPRETSVGDVVGFFKLGEMRKRRKWQLEINLEKLVGFCMVSWYPGNCRSRLVFNLHLDKSRAKENNKPLKAECKQICEQTGALLHPVDDISTYVEVFWLQYCGRGCDNLHQKQKM